MWGQPQERRAPSSGFVRASLTGRGFISPLKRGKIASLEPLLPKNPAELLQSLAAPRALLFANALRGPAASLPALNKTPRARYSAQSIRKASSCSHTELESQMRGINEHSPQ